MANRNPNPATRFKPGEAPRGGRPRESRDKLSKKFLYELAEDFEANGKSVIEAVRKDDPAAYLKVVASLQPKELEITRPEDSLTDEKMDEMIELLKSALPSPPPQPKKPANEPKVH